MKKEPTFDIRSIFPEIKDEITIIGNIPELLNKKQFEYLRDNNKLIEYGYDGETYYIKLQHLFTLDDIENKIEEICKGE